MMHLKQITLSLITLTLACSITACKKSNKGNSNNIASCKFSEIGYDFATPKAYKATYSKNKLTQLVSLADKVVFPYDASNHLIRKEVFDIGNAQVKFRSDYTVNASGQIAEQRSYENFNGGLRFDGKVEFAYSGKQLTEMIFTGSAGQDYGKSVYTWTGGNITKYSAVYGVDYEISYDLAKPNTFSHAFENYIFTDLYGGNLISQFFTLRHIVFLNANPIASITSARPDEGTNVKYTYNAQQLFSTIEMYGVPIWKFKYSCD